MVVAGTGALQRSIGCLSRKSNDKPYSEISVLDHVGGTGIDANATNDHYVINGAVYFCSVVKLPASWAERIISLRDKSLRGCITWGGCFSRIIKYFFCSKFSSSSWLASSRYCSIREPKS